VQCSMLLLRISSMHPDIINEYKRLRAQGVRASYALSNAKTRVAFSRIGAICYSNSSRLGADTERAYMDYGNTYPYVRLVLVPDDSFNEVTDFDCCDGNTPCECFYRYNRSHCEYGAECRHKHDEIERANRDGVYGLVAEYRTETGWELADSVWGFIGEDWKEYEVDAMRAAMHDYALGQHC
jgi:hypothetical protein